MSDELKDLDRSTVITSDWFDTMMNENMKAIEKLMYQSYHTLPSKFLEEWEGETLGELLDYIDDLPF